MKYEYKIFKASISDIDMGFISDREDEGWELCGKIDSPSKTWCASKATTIPMRKPRV